MNENTGNLDFKRKCSILNQVWQTYRYDDQFEDFVDYNDLGLPLAAMIDEGIVSSTPRAEIYVEETYALFLEALDVEDKDYDSMEAIFFEAGQSQ
jgi:hypothetical protein